MDKEFTNGRLGRSITVTTNLESRMDRVDLFTPVENTIKVLGPGEIRKDMVVFLIRMVRVSIRANGEMEIWIHSDQHQYLQYPLINLFIIKLKMGQYSFHCFKFAQSLVS